MAQLTAGSIQAIYGEDKVNPLYNNPVVQVINLKAVNVQGGARYRVIVSDGGNFMQAMLASHHSALVEKENLKRNSIILLKEFVCNSLQNRKILIILNFDILKTDVESKIGAPLTLEGPMSSNGNASSGNITVTPSIRSENVFLPQSFSTASNSNTSFNDYNVTPISSLNPYQTKWYIKARITQKAPMKKYHNAKGDGQLFSCNFLDQTGEIKATAFNDQATRVYNMLEEGKVYYISKARVVMAKKQFSTLTNDYELQFEGSTEIELCHQDSGIPQITYDFVTIANISNCEKDSNIDFIGVVTEDLGVSEFVSKASGKPFKKREFMVVDSSLQGIKVTAWGASAEEMNLGDNPIIACKCARVSDFNGRSLSIGNNTMMKLNPDTSDAQKLRRWFQDVGQTAHFNHFRSNNLGGGEASMSTRKTSLRQAKADGLGTNGKTDYFGFRGTVVFIKADNPAYPACPECKKKVLLCDEDVWRCEKCQKNYPKPTYRYILTASVEDETSQIYLNGFDDFGKALLNINADEFMNLKEKEAESAKQLVSNSLYRTYVFKVRAKEESYNDIQRVKYACLEVNEIDYVTESQDMVNQIEKLFLN